jgi:prevent-host-death family protein
MEIVMKKMAAGKFKAQCLKIMDRVKATREPVVITKKGRPVAKLVPVESTTQGYLGSLVRTIQIVGDIESPVESIEAWEVLR